MTTTQELLESSFELNLSNYGPEDVERLNDWAIKAYAALEALQAEHTDEVMRGLMLEKAHAMGLAERDAALARLAESEAQNLMARQIILEHGEGVAGASPVEPSESVEYWHRFYFKKCQELLDEKARLGAEIETLELAAIDDAERYTVQPSQAQPPAPGEAAREYMTGYGDGKEWVGATIQTLVDALKDATQSLETISMLAGRKTYGNPPIETFMETFSEVRGYAISRAGVGREAIAALRAQPSPLLQFCTCEDCKPMECEGCRINRERRELLLAPSDAAREYMNGYSDGREWAGAANQAQPSQALEPTEAQLVTGVKAMRLFVTKNSIKDFRDGFIAAITAAKQAQPEPYGYHSPKTGKVYASTEAASMAMAGEVKTVYLAQPERAPLTDAEIKKISSDLSLYEDYQPESCQADYLDPVKFARAIIAAINAKGAAS